MFFSCPSFPPRAPPPSFPPPLLLHSRRLGFQEDRELHTRQKEEHRRQIEVLWDKLNVPVRYREVRAAVAFPHRFCGLFFFFLL